MPRRVAKRFPRGQPSMENSKAPSPAGSKFRQAGGFFLPWAVPKGGDGGKEAATMACETRRLAAFCVPGRRAAGRAVRVPSGDFRKRQKKMRFCVPTKPHLWCAGRDSPAPLRTVRRTVRPGRDARRPDGLFESLPETSGNDKKRRGFAFPQNLFFGAAEHSASELFGLIFGTAK